MSQFRIPGCLCFIAGDNLDHGTLARHRHWSARGFEPIGAQRAAPNVDPSAPVVSPAAIAAVEGSGGTDPEIEALELATTARTAAYALKRAYPGVVFTSGRRNKSDQARAMAGNVVKNRRWIEETYAKSAVRTQCQNWVDANPSATVRGEIAAGLLSVFDGLSDTELGRFSKHLSGEAFDVQPVEADGEAIKATIRGLPGLGKFLDMEGGLVRWHAQF